MCGLDDLGSPPTAFKLKMGLEIINSIILIEEEKKKCFDIQATKGTEANFQSGSDKMNKLSQLISAST